MKLVSYQHTGQDSYGAIVGDGVVDLGRLYGARAPDLKAFIAADLFADASTRIAQAQVALPLSEVTLLPVIPNPGKILCVGLNYGEHIRETGKTVTEKPVIFLRVASSQVASGDDIVHPRVSEQLDYEGEIAIVIGQGGRHIAEADAWPHIAGYSCYNDGSVRDWQFHTSQWGPGKNFWKTGAFGPWMVSADEIAPDQTMTLVTRLNGQELQRATTDMMVHSIPRLIAYISTFVPLEAGDVIVTGTPGGVGSKRTPPVFMKPGDVCEVEVDAIGTLRNGIRAE
ncbi:fumarylacetoacetate hydrolase family protein [Hydrogenophaga laconesensis]|uniref:2-keto-4-pentenoate hydratase/2-oxohepta-3-ene-1,7-dioic acid hydratase in catechol pathway n=1 Tax=Hydrogenophaga laconesensis TaxID=1805971 RepID=A0ABU1V5R1_9BURK|nr:fumarylacetoacetate hydrolase family protein [Hydrogenophaga laconesensis]MDR7092623.1 2-keto-4-pentenoate hydratase/2-oxohepta-3-ene-1,7-dioic acid hydratase in catechol pathway [Hydrogenophaga laconesensis]